MVWDGVLSRLAKRAPEVQPRRNTFVSIDEVPCATAAVTLFSPTSRPMVVAYRVRAQWIACPPSPSTHSALAALAAQGACEVELRSGAKRRFIRLSTS